MEEYIVLIITQLLQSIASISFVISAVKLNILPAKYITILIVVLGFLFLATLILQSARSWKKIWGAALSILIIIGLGAGSYLLNVADSTMEELTTPDEYYDKVVFVVKKDSTYTTVRDMGDCSFGIQYSLQKDLMEAAKNKMASELNSELRIKEYESIIEQVDALLTNEVDVILYNDSYSDLLVECVQNYSDKVKIVCEYKLTRNDISSLCQGVEIQPIKPQPDNDNHNNDIFAVYLSGIDVRGEISRNSRSDVNIIAVVDKSKNKILLITTPRDSFVKIPGVSGDKKDKLTHAGIYGVDASMNTLEALYDIELDYYFRVNFTSFERIIDALGGISVYSDSNFSYQGRTFYKGYNDVNGKDALKFCRERKSLAGGDRQRGKHQQEVIKAVINKACSPAILTSAGSILDSVKDGIDTNIPEALIQEMIKKQLDDGKGWDVEMMSADGTGKNAITYSMPGVKLYVMELDEKIIESIKAKIDMMYE